MIDWNDKEQRRQYDAAYYQSRKPLRLQQNALWSKSYREWIASLKTGKPCTDCGLILHHAAMQWDHLPQFIKSFNIADASKYSREKVLTEIAKCELVCANCHAVRTYERTFGN